MTRVLYVAALTRGARGRGDHALRWMRGLSELRLPPSGNRRRTGGAPGRRVCATGLAVALPCRTDRATAGAGALSGATGTAGALALQVHTASLAFRDAATGIAGAV